MTEHPPLRKKGTYPTLYSFITFRRERNGGLVFNPYLFQKWWIDECTSYVVGCIDGKTPVKTITASVRRRYSFGVSEAERIVHQTLEDLENIYAVYWKITPSKSDPKTQSSTVRGRSDQQIFPAPLSVIWDVTYRCNLRCKHCLIERSVSGCELDTSEAKKVIDQLKRMKVLTITFSGGEPLLRNDIFDILHYASEQHLGVYLNSNGLLLTDSTLNTLSDIGVQCIQISLDGLEATHDAFRGKKGAYKKTCDALRRASDAGFYTIMSTTLTSHNMDEFTQLVDVAKKCHVSSFKINGFVPAGRGRRNAIYLNISREYIQDFVCTITRLKEENRDTLDIQMDALYPWLLQPEPKSIHSVRGYCASPQIGCSAGHSNLVIAPDGTVFACPFLTAFPLGNLMITPLQDIWNNQDSVLSVFRDLHQEDLSGTCRTCSYVPEFCTGGCRAMAYNVNNDLYAEDPSCWIHQKKGSRSSQGQILD